MGISAVCNINTTESFNDTDFNVRWFINETMVYEQKNQHKISDEYDVDALDPKKCAGGGEPHQCILNSKLGSYVQCEVSLKFKEQDVFSPRVRSNTFYAGLTVEPNNTIEFDIGANSGIEFNITSTIPLVCHSQSLCSYIKEIAFNIDVDIDGNYAYSDNSCKKRFTNVSPATFNIIAAKTWFKYANKANYIRFKGDATFDTTLSRIWKSRQTSLPTFKIIANGVNVKSCSGSGDPHYRTFDGWYYHIYGTGDFIFYEHTTLPIKIQTRLAKCYSVTCTCGVAVQVGHTHLIVDRCNGAGNTYTTFKATHDGVVKEVRTPTNAKVTTAEILKDGERTPGTSLEYKNRQFKINLPTGSYITITLFWSHYVSVFMTGSWDDFENIKGLCGNFDNKLHNDGQYGSYGNAGDPDYKCVKPEDCEPAYYNTVNPRKFYNSWRVKNNENIFLGALNVDNPYEIKRYCSCEEGNIKCDHCNGLNANNNNLGCGSDDDEETNGVRRRKREVEVNDLDDQAGNYEFTPFNGDPDFEPQVPEFPTPNGLTEEYTTKICTETLLNSTTYEVCLDAINNGSITIDDIIEGCIVDIMVADDESIAKQTVTELQDRCQLELTTNPQYWEVSENGTLVPPTELLGQLCVNECSDKGECINGTCVCIEGFGGSDCSISLAEPPLVFAVLGDGLCDIRSRPCRSAKVYGENFDERGNITCHIQHINVSDIGVTLLQETSIVSGIFRTDQEVKCALPEPAVQPGSPGEGVVASGYLISISNDGELKSEEMAILIIYDSVCQVCNASEGECYLKNNSCNIDGHCYAAFDVNTEDCCQQCLPEDSVDSWLPRKDDAAPIIYTSNPYPAIHQEPITFTFDIQDPEGCGITFNKTYGNVNVTISTSGEFNWAPAMSNPDSIFEIHMQDKCGFSVTFNFSVDVCKCENGEICAFVNESSLYECVSPEPLNETTITEVSERITERTELSNKLMSTANFNEAVSTSTPMPTNEESKSSAQPALSITEMTDTNVTPMFTGNNKKPGSHPTSSVSQTKQFSTVYESSIPVSYKPSFPADNVQTSGETTSAFSVDTSKYPNIATESISSHTDEENWKTTTAGTVPETTTAGTVPETTTAGTVPETTKAGTVPETTTTVNVTATAILDDIDSMSSIYNEKGIAIQQFTTTESEITTPATTADEMSSSSNSDASKGEQTEQTTIAETRGTDQATLNKLVSIASRSSSFEQTSISETDGTNMPTIVMPDDSTPRSDEGNRETTRRTTISDPVRTDQITIYMLNEMSSISSSYHGNMETTEKTTITKTERTTTPAPTYMLDDIALRSTIDDGSDKTTNPEKEGTSTQTYKTSTNYDDMSIQTTIPEVNVPRSEATKSVSMRSTSTVSEYESTSSNLIKDTSHHSQTTDDTDTSTGIETTDRPTEWFTKQGTQDYASSPLNGQVFSSSSIPILNTHTKNTESYFTDSLNTKETDDQTVYQNDGTNGLTTLERISDLQSTVNEGSNNEFTTEEREEKVVTTYNVTSPTGSTYVNQNTNRFNKDTDTVTKTNIQSTTSSSDTHKVSIVLIGQQWTTKKEIFRSSVSKAVNTYCYTHIDLCCAWTETNSKNVLITNITKLENVKLIKDTEDTDNNIDIVLLVEYKDYSETCSLNNDERRRRDANQHKTHIARRNTHANENIPSQAVKSSIEQGKESIEAAIQMKISYVSLYSEKETSPSEDEPSYTVFIVIGVCSVAVFVFFVFVLIIYKWYVLQIIL
ncbi:von Willebrand factor D and EGF domain-containing protein-like [Antedon mediterranea]|uniref:von Willebrand factor D and EGF domain-containing protein-like n=1 Tax=Antedon mediterranea TaxID=105859 RepID=UPI003AF7C7EA